MIEDVIQPGEPNDDMLTIYVGKNINNLMNNAVLNTLTQYKLESIDDFTTNLLGSEGYIFVLLPANLARPNNFVLSEDCSGLPIPFNILPNKMMINNSK